METTTEQNTRKPISTWMLLASLYMTQYLGLGFFWIALVAIMRRQGVTLERLGVIYLLALFWVLKFLWAPLVDRFGSARLGHYRGWLLLTQSGMVLSLVIIGCFDIATQFGAVFAGCVALAFLSSTQDIATDGLSCRLLSKKERGMGNGIQAAGGMLGNMLGGGAVLMAYPYLGWKGCMGILAAGTAISLVQVLCFHESHHAVDLSKEQALSRRFWRFWQIPGHKKWLLMLLIFPVGSALGYALITPILVDTGWPMARIGMLINMVGATLSVLAALLTGWLLRQRTRFSVMIGTAAAQVVGLLALVLMLTGPADNWRIFCAAGIYFLSRGALFALMSTLMMDRASLKSPATDFTLQYSVYSLVMFTAAVSSTALAGASGYLTVLAAACTVACLALFLSLYLTPPESRIEPRGLWKESNENMPASCSLRAGLRRNDG
jgi:MFS family permease